MTMRLASAAFTGGISGGARPNNNCWAFCAYATMNDDAEIKAGYSQGAADQDNDSSQKSEPYQASYVWLVASVHRSSLDAPNRRASIIDAESAGSMCDTPQARHSKV
jgi:hypothetical protein